MCQEGTVAVWLPKANAFHRDMCKFVSLVFFVAGLLMRFPHFHLPGLKNKFWMSVKEAVSIRVHFCACPFLACPFFARSFTSIEWLASQVVPVGHACDACDNIYWMGWMDLLSSITQCWFGYYMATWVLGSEYLRLCKPQLPPHGTSLEWNYHDKVLKGIQAWLKFWKHADCWHVERGIRDGYFMAWKRKDGWIGASWALWIVGGNALACSCGVPACAERARPGMLG